MRSIHTFGHPAENPWVVISALFVGMFDDHTIEWLNKREYFTWVSTDKQGQSSPPSMR
jgi:hypothetical protein